MDGSEPPMQGWNQPQGLRVDVLPDVDSVMVAPPDTQVILVFHQKGLHLFTARFGDDIDDIVAFRLEGLGTLADSIAGNWARLGFQREITPANLIHEFSRIVRGIPPTALAEAYLLSYAANNPVIPIL